MGVVILLACLALRPDTDAGGSSARAHTHTHTHTYTHTHTNTHTQLQQPSHTASYNRNLFKFWVNCVVSYVCIAHRLNRNAGGSSAHAQLQQPGPPPVAANHAQEHHTTHSGSMHTTGAKEVSCSVGAGGAGGGGGAAAAAAGGHTKQNGCNGVRGGGGLGGDLFMDFVRFHPVGMTTAEAQELRRLVRTLAYTHTHTHKGQVCRNNFTPCAHPICSNTCT